MTEKLKLKRNLSAGKKDLKKSPLKNKFTTDLKDEQKKTSLKINPVHKQKNKSNYVSSIDTKSQVNSVSGSATRAAAAICINAVELGQSLNDVLPKAIADFEPRDKAFVQELVYGTLRYRRLLGLTLKKYLNRSIPVKFALIRSLLLCGLYQISFTRTPPHAVVASTVGACQALHLKHLTGLVNALLRTFLRNGAHLEHSAYADEEQSFPKWLYQMLVKDYGEDKALTIMQESNAHAPLWIRVEESKITTQEYLDILEKADLKGEISQHCTSAIKLYEPVGVDRLPLFAQGMVTVQDLSAQLAAPLLKLEEGQDVLDACAAPGGKTAHILEICPNINLIATDINEQRLKSCEQTLKRLRKSCTLKVSDASNLSEISGQFDRILADVPCSGTGVIRRHPDIKWLRRQKDIEALTHAQDLILDKLFDRLKPGGILVYTTCSILKAENQERIESFLKRQSKASLLPFNIYGKECSMYQNLPSSEGGDGFFYARIMKSL